MKLVCISDTHSLHWRLPAIPDGDVLIHAGDSLGQGTLENIEELNEWLGTLPHRYKIVIAGNHDWAFQETPELARQALTNAIYLEDSSVEIESIRFWGSPWTPTFMDWAFMLERGEPLHHALWLFRHQWPLCSSILGLLSILHKVVTNAFRVEPLVPNRISWSLVAFDGAL